MDKRQKVKKYHTINLTPKMFNKLVEVKEKYQLRSLSEAIDFLVTSLYINLPSICPLIYKLKKIIDEEDLQKIDQWMNNQNNKNRNI